MVSDLYKRTNYLNKEIEFIFGNDIHEYDIKSAGFNIIKKFKFLPDEQIQWLEGLERHSRHVAIGKLEKSVPDLTKNLKRGFTACRKKLMLENDIVDNDILSIKKDAIFIVGRALQNTKFDNIEFVEKNVYESYIYLNRVEFYFNDEICDCKGITDEKVALHQNYMLDIFKELGKLMRHSNHKRQLAFLKEVAVAYRNRELEHGYYRELNKRSLFRPINDINVLNSKMGYNFYGGDLNKINISYNYMNYFIPIFRFLT